MIFSVWAPMASTVELVLDSARLAMDRAERGYWSVDAVGTGIGQRYRFSVDGGPPWPDPRSRRQPDGVHGSSERIDVDELRRNAMPEFLAKPLRNAVLYELHVGTFTPEGTYAAAAQKLQHLVDLGVTHVELMPLATFPGNRGWGYDGVDLYAPHPAYGTPLDLARFVAQCHESGLAVLLDVVYNHLGPDGNYLAGFGPYFTDQVRTPWGAAINFDGPHSDGVRDFVIDNALMWLEDYGFDGLRLDAVQAIYNFVAVHLLEDLAAAVRGLEARSNRRLTLIAESDLNDPFLVLPSSRGGIALDAHWADDFHHALHRSFTGDASGYYSDFNGLEDLAAAMRGGYVYQGQYSQYRQRRHGRPPYGVAPEQLVVCAQNHDQIGNRAQGERLSMLLEPSQLKAIAALTLLSPFVPMLFQGEEWGASTPFIYFTDHQDAELGRSVTAGRAVEFKAFGWVGEVPNPQAFESFARCKLVWSELGDSIHAELFQWHRDLIRLRREMHVAPGWGDRDVEFDAAREWFRFANGAVLVVCNLAARPQRVPLAVGRWELALESAVGFNDNRALLPAYGTQIFTRRD